uniref:Uncharacterized protein n=1 Tax=Mus musculus TaxID=10090 RepID=Q3UMZ1_MOUSE|nr:unnamed protein product [Mus musculus]
MRQLRITCVACIQFFLAVAAPDSSSFIRQPSLTLLAYSLRLSEKRSPLQSCCQSLDL